jgi:uncharacterized protein
MLAPLLASMLVLGLASGVHCVAMCGGFVGAFAQARVIRIQPARRPWRALALFNAGRITSYSVAGAAAGAVGGLLDFQTALYALANVTLIAIGVHLAGLPVLNVFERLGTPLWRRIQPLLSRNLLAASAYGAGLLWGWLP